MPDGCVVVGTQISDFAFFFQKLVKTAFLPHHLYKKQSLKAE